ncbi:adenosylmethionine--8-amino-7-oxononanoate transaminase [Anaeromyxobacter dehalogenans]|uniref:Adenosylmethionine-8-amino-7-oxononanoate aminotransferase n=1 Tax=Anaeromyxobacter dehalogenans (strain 2CP-C) TaxID=290397 RepID=Q2IM15_ANADE|nr:adenosylmethionine--8-amino-7-oxononanoate transaminase [Anaeromyxobacter dehalogenans]ABC79847.1 adenosylmethionine-8-amino-7-oxononanoate aminotransferase apoenzyme [Anaeromyxobacter dehalogenans 2CP-C]
MEDRERQERHRRLWEADHRHLWHPFTQMKDWLREEPLIVDAAEGVYLVDTLGNRYLDGVSSLWCNVHGHRVPELDAAVRAQLDRVAHSTLLGLASTASIECAEELVRHLPPGLTRVFFSDAGATAVEIAIKMAFQHHQLRGDERRTEFVALHGGYHGDTIGSVSVGGIDLFHRIFKPLLFEVHHAPQPYCYRCPLGKALPGCGMACADEVERIVEAREGRVAALVIEPLVQGADGMITQPPGYLRRMREVCDRHGALLVCDEVATGWGRTGTTFAVEQEGVRPDILTMAKGLTGGYLPLAATVTTEQVFESFLGEHAEKRTFFHGHTYAGNPLACAAATASMTLFRERGVGAAVPGKAAALARALAPAARLAHVGEVRQRGLMVGIELVRDRATREEYAYELRAGDRVTREARKLGAILRPLGNVVVLMPPLAMTEAELTRLAGITLAAIEAATARL